MTLLIGTLLFTIFTSLSGLHVYWALGGRWETDSVLPTIDENTTRKMPGVGPTLVVAAGLLVFALLVLSRISLIRFPVLHDLIFNYSMWVIFAIFLLRAIGDFKYVGVFKKIRHTKFGINDTKYYTPLCLLIAVLAFILATQ